MYNRGGSKRSRVNCFVLIEPALVLSCLLLLFCLDLCSRCLQDDIPAELARLPKLQMLHLANNKLSGTY